MKVVIAPDKFAGTLTAAEAAKAMAAGWHSVRRKDELVLVPMADGGEGTLDVDEAAVKGSERQKTIVPDARGMATTAEWLWLPDGRGLVESAQAVGLSKLPADLRDPLMATSYGVGDLMMIVRGCGVIETIVGVGGTASADGGGGMASGLKHRLRREDNNCVKVGAQYLYQVDRVELGDDFDMPVVAAVDVNSPLLGPSGGIQVFAPQKGARPGDLLTLETAVTRFADVVERDLPGGPWRDRPGAGAGGGIGFALMAFLNARVVPGAMVIADLVGLSAAVDEASVVLTGEGSLDAQTATGKTPAAVAALGHAAGAKVFAIAGRVQEGAEAGFDAVKDLGPDGPFNAAALVRERAAELARSISQ